MESSNGFIKPQPQKVSVFSNTSKLGQSLMFPKQQTNSAFNPVIGKTQPNIALPLKDIILPALTKTEIIESQN